MSEPYDHEHEWEDSYYGYQCKDCPAFLPYGCAPWEDDDDYPDEQMMERIFIEDDDE